MEIARVTTVSTGYLGAPGVSTFYFRKRTALGWDNYTNDLIQRIHEFWQDSAAYLSTAVTYTTQAEVQIVQDTDGELQSAQIGTTAASTGSDANGMSPQGAGIVVSWLTPDIANGHRVRGRTFMVPVSLSSFDVYGKPTTAAQQALQLAAEGVIGSGGEAVVPVVWHRPKKDPVTHAITRAGSAHDVDQAAVGNKTAVLRSRRD
jgi:hypothetical protein